MNFILRYGVQLALFDDHGFVLFFWRQRKVFVEFSQALVQGEVFVVEFVEGVNVVVLGSPSHTVRSLLGDQ